MLVLGSQPAGDVSHKPGGRLPLLSAGPAVTPAESCYQFRCLVNRGTLGVNSLPKNVTRERRSCDLNPGPSAPDSSTLTTRLLSHPQTHYCDKLHLKEPRRRHVLSNKRTRNRVNSSEYRNSTKSKVNNRTSKWKVLDDNHKNAQETFKIYLNR